MICTATCKSLQSFPFFSSISNICSGPIRSGPKRSGPIRSGPTGTLVLELVPVLGHLTLWSDFLWSRKNCAEMLTQNISMSYGLENIGP